MNDDDVNILAAGGARYVAGPTETGGTVMWGGGGAIAHPQQNLLIQKAFDCPSTHILRHFYGPA